MSPMLRYLPIEFPVRSSMRRGHLHRCFAVLLLLFASAEIFIDAVWPELCCEELSGLAEACAPGADVATGAARGLDTISAVDNPAHEPSSSPVNGEEECFCCCAHILPSLHFKVADVDVGPLARDLANAILPITPLERAYHPPRLS